VSEALAASLATPSYECRPAGITTGMDVSSCGRVFGPADRAVCPDYVQPASLAGEAFFEDRSFLLTDNPTQKFYGISITDVNGDGQLDAFVTGNGARNMVYSWSPATRTFINIATPILEDASRAVSWKPSLVASVIIVLGAGVCIRRRSEWPHAISTGMGLRKSMCSTRTRMVEQNSKRIVSSAPLAEEVCRCEERLLSCVGSVIMPHAHQEIEAQLHMAVGRMQPTLRRLRCVVFLQYQDLFDRDDNTEVQNKIAGRSVACLDRTGYCFSTQSACLVPLHRRQGINFCAPGSGSYGVAAANYGGPMKLFETYPGSNTRLRDMAPQVGIIGTTGGRGALALHFAVHD